MPKAQRHILDHPGGLCRKLVSKQSSRGEGKTYMLCVRKAGHKGKCRDFLDDRLRKSKKKKT